MRSHHIPEYGARAGSAFLTALLGSVHHTKDEHYAKAIQEAGGKSSDTKVSLQRDGERRMWLDEFVTIAVETDRGFALRWLAGRLGVPAPEAAPSMRDAFALCRRSMGRLLGGMEDATSPDSDDGEELSEVEARSLLADIHAHKQLVEKIERALEARLRGAA